MERGLIDTQEVYHICVYVDTLWTDSPRDFKEQWKLVLKLR